MGGEKKNNTNVSKDHKVAVGNQKKNERERAEKETQETAEKGTRETTEIMQENIQKMKERGEGLEDLSKQTESTEDSAKRFSENAQRVREKYSSKNKSWFEDFFS